MTRMEPTEEMVNALYAWMGAHDVTLPDDALQSLLGILAASPGQGAVTAQQFEEAAIAVHDVTWERLDIVVRDETADAIVSAVLSALGLTVQP